MSRTIVRRVDDRTVIVTKPRGPAGRDGDDGQDGQSAYQIAVANGFVGTQAQWLASLATAPPGPQGLPGINGGIGSSAGFAALFSAANGMVVGAGISAIITAGHTWAGKGGATYIYDAAVDAAFVAAHPRWAFLAADGRGFRIDPDQRLTPLMFGAKADFVTDDTAAFEAAIASVPGAMTLHVPGRYYLPNGLNFHKPISIIGDGSGQNSDAFGTTIRIGKNSNGFVFNHFNTHGDTTGSYSTSSGGSSVFGVALWGGNVNVNGAGATTTFAAGDSTTGHGVRIRAPFVRLVDVWAVCFGEDGFNVNCSAGGSAYIQGNANSFYLAQCQAQYNGGCGYLINGADANAGTTDTCSAISNRLSGILDFSFLGNTHIQPHVRDNGITDSTGSGRGVGSCQYLGQNYYVVLGQDAAASTTTPGTNSAVWRPFPVYPNATAKVWTSGLTWAFGRPFATNPGNEGNGRGNFLNAYAESAQAPILGGRGWLFTGGVIDECGVDPDNKAVLLKGGDRALFSQTFRTFDQAGSAKAAALGEAGQPTTALLYTDGTNTYRLKGDGALGMAFNVGVDLWNVVAARGGWAYPMATRLLHVSDAAGDVANSRIRAGITNLSQLNGKAVSYGDEFGFISPLGYRGVVAMNNVTVDVTNPAHLAFYGKIGLPVVDSGTGRTAALTDAGLYLRFTSGSAVTFTIPPNSAVAFPLGTEIDGIQAGAGALTIAPGSGVTLNASGADLILAGQFASFTAKKVGTNEWDVVGKF